MIFFLEEDFGCLYYLFCSIILFCVDSPHLGAYVSKVKGKPLKVPRTLCQQKTFNNLNGILAIMSYSYYLVAVQCCLLRLK